MNITAKEVLQRYIKVPVDTISTNNETMYVSNALLAMEEYASLKCQQIIKAISVEFEEKERKLDEILHPETKELRDRMIDNLQKKVDSINE